MSDRFGFFGDPQQSSPYLHATGVSLFAEVDAAMRVQESVADLRQVTERTLRWEIPLADAALRISARSLEIAAVARGLEGNRNPGLESAADGLESIVTFLHVLTRHQQLLDDVVTAELRQTVTAGGPDIEAGITSFKSGGQS